MRALVTGGAGFVGRHLCGALLERGWEVVCVDSLTTRTGAIAPEHWPFLKPLDYATFHFRHEDCRNYFKTASDEHFDYAFHLAAIVGGRLMIEYEPLAVADDLAIDALFWRWAERARPGKIINFSSSAAYPVALQRQEGYRLLREDDITLDGDIGMPDLTYGWSKLTAEFLGKLAFDRHGLKSVVYRPFSGYGEDQDMSYPFPSIAARVLELKGPQMPVWGSGRQLRDFVHIQDCVRAVLSTMDKIDDGSAMNISSGLYTSFIDLAALMLERAGKRATVAPMSDKPEGVFARGGDRTLQAALGFTPSIPLAGGIDRALEHLAVVAR